jgi:putative PIN family toxin of toxin-antitoxin system
VRAVVDINVWVSSQLSRLGVPARVQQAYRDGKFTHITSEPLLADLASVLSRPRIAQKYHVTTEDIADLTRLLQNGSVIVPISGTVRVCRDPDDDVVIETAIRGRADVIVSGDADLLEDPNVAAFLSDVGIAVWNARRFLQALDDEAI